MTPAPARPAHLINGETVQRFLASPAGRATIRREVVEQGQVRQGQVALILLDDQAPEGTEAVVEVVADVLREQGLQVVTLTTDVLLPLARGGMPGSFAAVEHHRLPKAIFAAIEAADVIFDYSASGRGSQKYNLDFYLLSHYFGKRIVGKRAVEAPEILWSETGAEAVNEAALSFPSDLLRTIGDHVNQVLFDAAEAGDEFRLTNPWGTDLRFHALPGDICLPQGGVRRHPRDSVFYGDDCNRLYRALTGFAVTQRCSGAIVTMFCTLLGGALQERIRVTLSDGFIAAAEGGSNADRLMSLVQDEPSGVHAILTGLHPKAAPFLGSEYMLGNDGAGVGVAHLGMGGPGLFYRAGEWGSLGNKHFQLGNLPKISLWAGDRQVVADGQLLALSDPAIREAARHYGDPDELLRQFNWPEHI